MFVNSCNSRVENPRGKRTIGGIFLLCNMRWIIFTGFLFLFWGCQVRTRVTIHKNGTCDISTLVSSLSFFPEIELPSTLQSGDFVDTVIGGVRIFVPLRDTMFPIRNSVDYIRLVFFARGYILEGTDEAIFQLVTSGQLGKKAQELALGLESKPIDVTITYLKSVEVTRLYLPVQIHYRYENVPILELSKVDSTIHVTLEGGVYAIVKAPLTDFVDFRLALESELPIVEANADSVAKDGVYYWFGGGKPISVKVKKEGR